MLDRRLFIGSLLALAAAPAVAGGLVSYPPPDRELMVPVEGGRIYVRVNGDLAAPAPPIVFIHGGPGGNHAAYLEALALAGERAVILYDQLDSGRSERPGDPANWRVPRFVDEVEAVRQALTVRRWHVLGHSWGGAVALEYGARQPEGLVSLILASPLVSTRSWIADANALRRGLPSALKEQLASCTRHPQPGCDEATAAYYARFVRREPLSAAAQAYHANLPGGAGQRLYQTMWGPSEFVCTGTLKSYDGEPLLARLDGERTLFIGGQHDEAVPARLAAFADEVPGGAELATIPGSAHSLFTDRPEETLGVLRGWLARKDPG
jgi:proline-specific peptidase